MKTGKTLNELAAEITRRAEAKKDFIAPSQVIAMVIDNDTPMINLNDQHQFAINKIAHGQIAEYAGIPQKYYERMQADDPALLATNVNRWLHDDSTKSERRMVRTLDGKVRALLSDRYRKIENEDIAEAVLPVLMDRDMQIMSADITETRLYIKAVDKSIEKYLPRGAKIGDGSHHIVDCLSPAVIMGNSEVGMGSYFIETGVFTKLCTNLAVFGAQMKKAHVGARAEHSAEVYELLTSETKRLTDAALFGQLRDIIAGSLNQVNFEQKVALLNATAEDKMTANVVEIVEQVGKRFNVNEGERKGVLAHLIEGGDLSRYGLHSAITRFSADVADYDRATELERLGGSIVQMPKSDWTNLLKLAA